MSYVSQYIGKTLRNLRVDEGLSLVILARETKINLFKLTGYEMGIMYPNSEDLTTLADYFKCTIDLIIGLDSPNVDTLSGNDLPQILRDSGCTSISVTAGHKLTDDEAESLVKFLSEQRIIDKEKHPK